VTSDLWLLLLLLLLAVWLAAHNHELRDSDPIIWDVPATSGDSDD
jgi:hypothetical protein